MKTYYFMSGLPRAGSTLLSAILNQNPRFYSGPSSPVVPAMIGLETTLSNEELYLAYPKREQAAKMIGSLLENYYSDVDKPVIFDKNRSWVNRLHYIPGYFGIEAKVLCPVRDIKDILASFITMQRRSTYSMGGTKLNVIDEMLVKSNLPLTDLNRCQFLASDAGILGQSYLGIKQALIEGQEKSLHFIEYNDLLNSPQKTMQQVYDFLEEEYFDHTFDNLENKYREKDEEIYGFPDMHEVRSTLSRRSIKAEEILDEQILELCQDAEFWRSANDPITYDDESPNWNSLNETNEYQQPSIIGA